MDETWHIVCNWKISNEPLNNTASCVRPELWTTIDSTVLYFEPTSPGFIFFSEGDSKEDLIMCSSTYFASLLYPIRDEKSTAEKAGFGMSSAFEVLALSIALL